MSRPGMLLTLCACLTVFGCQQSDDFNEYSEAPLSENTDTGHSHGHEGAHGGKIIDIDAAHAHHAEMVFDAESRDITIYFYGAEIGQAHPANGLVVELEDGDDEVHLDVTTSPLQGETEETASRFVVPGTEVPEGTKSLADLEGHFHVTLDGQDFLGSFGDHSGHDHGEEGHGHDEDGEDHGEDGHDEEGHDHDESGHGEEDTDAEGSEPAAE